MDCNNKEISDKLLLHAEEELTDAETRLVSDHLETCSRCRAELDDIRTATGILRTGADRIRENWTHISPEELVDYEVNPHQFDPEKKSLIEAHLSLCQQCAQELDMLRQVPEEEPGTSPETAEIPRQLKEAFVRTYPSDAKPARDKESFTGDLSQNFWQKLRSYFGGPSRLAYAVGILLVIVSVIFLAGHPREHSPGQDPGIAFARYEPAGISEDRLDRLSQFLSDSGIPSRMEKGNLYIDANRRNEADLALARFIRGEMIARDGGSMPWYSPGEGEWSEHDEFFYRMHSNSRMLVADAQGRFPQSAPVSVYGRQPVISAFSVLEDQESDIILARISRNRARSIYGADMEDRQRATARIQEQMQQKAQNAIQDYPSIAGSPVKVFVTLSFQKNTAGEYQLESYTVIIEKASGLSQSDRDKVRADIREALGVQKDWDEEFLFLDR